MSRFLFLFLVLISSRGLWAQSTDPLGSTSSDPSAESKSSDSQPSKSADFKVAATEESKVTGIMEFYFPTSSVETKIDPGFGTNTEVKKSSPFSLGFGIGGQSDNNRGYLLMSFEKLGSFSVNGVETSPLNVGFKLAYDRTFKPWITDFYLSGAFTYYPKQGTDIVANSKNFAPKDSFGLEVSVGWISPINVAFNFGYKAVSKEYAYESINPNNSQSIDEHAFIHSGWAFVSASIGRY